MRVKEMALTVLAGVKIFLALQGELINEDAERAEDSKLEAGLRRESEEEIEQCRIRMRDLKTLAFHQVFMATDQISNDWIHAEEVKG